MEELERTFNDDPIALAASPRRTKTYYRKIDERTREKSNADLLRLSRAFKITGGCKTIDNERIKLFLFVRGFGFVSPWEGKLYFWGQGNPGGPLGQLLEHTHYTFANAYTGATGSFLEIGKDGILWKNDHLMQGVLPILDRYNLMLSHTELSIYMALVNSRLQNIGLAGRDAEAKAYEMVFDSIEDGEMKAIVDRNLLNKTTTLPNQGRTECIKELIELEQYLKATKWNELGLNANWNAKRESLSNSENLMNTDTMMPLLEDMYDSWTEALDAINEKYPEYLDSPFGLEFANAWEVNEAEQEQRIEIAETDPEEMNPETEESTEENSEEDPKEKEEEKDETD